MFSVEIVTKTETLFIRDRFALRSQAISAIADIAATTDIVVAFIRKV